MKSLTTVKLAAAALGAVVAGQSASAELIVGYSLRTTQLAPTFEIEGGTGLGFTSGSGAPTSAGPGSRVKVDSIDDNGPGAAFADDQYVEFGFENLSTPYTVTGVSLRARQLGSLFEVAQYRILVSVNGEAFSSIAPGPNLVSENRNFMSALGETTIGASFSNRGEAYGDGKFDRVTSMKVRFYFYDNFAASDSVLLGRDGITKFNDGNSYSMVIEGNEYIPEPTSVALIGAGAGLLGLRRRRSN